MEYRNLGRTGVQVSPLCLGCLNFGAKTTEAEGIQVMHRAMDLGINFFDTANIYSLGQNEQLIGKALAEDGRRDRMVLATKVRSPMGDGPNDWGNHRYHIIPQCEASLRRLKTDRIDLYQLHRPDSAVPIDETLRALDQLIRQGKVLYIGTSHYAAWQLCESLWVARELGLNRFISETPPFNILERRAERELLPFCRTHGFAVIPWGPLSGGMLTGKYKPDGSAPPGSRFKAELPDSYAGCRKKRVFDVIDALHPLAKKKGCPLSQFVLSWCVHQPGITSPIIGPRTIQQLEDNVKALQVELTNEDREAVDQLVAPGDHVSDAYVADFGPHLHR